MQEVRIDAATESHLGRRQKTEPGIFLIDTLAKNQNKNSVAPFARIQMGQLLF